MSSLKEKAYDELKHRMLVTRRKIKAQVKDKDRSNPIDIDIVKSLKAMYYEQALEVFRKESKISKARERANDE